MHELLGVIAAEVRALGPDAGVEEVTVSQGAFPPGDEAVYVVEPHEFFLKTPAADQPTRDQLARTIAICVEHPGTASFGQTVDTAGRVAARMDINDDSTFALNELGMPTERFHLGYSEQWDVWGGADSQRTHDVVFLGTIDPRRSRNIALDIEAVDEASVLLAMPPHEPMDRPRPHFFTGREKLQLLADSKVIVNLHRERCRSFEWVRALEAMCNGCVVVSEHSTDFAPLTPGKDVLFGSSRSLFTLSRALLSSPDRLADIRAACYETIRSTMSMVESAQQLAALAADLSRGVRPHPPRASGVPPRVLPPSPSYGVVYSSTRDTFSVEMPALGSEDELFPLPLLQSRPALRVAGANRSADSLDVLILRSPGWPDFDWSLSSVLPQLAGMNSVVHLCPDAVPDDARDLPENVVLHAADPDAGPGSARNRAVEASDAAQILVLNSTDALLPHAVERLRHALEKSHAGVAYGMVITADGLITSAHPYEQDRLDRTDYLAAAALWRRSALVESGGWSDGGGWQGQEVRDLWWRLGALGGSATLVPRPLIRQAPVQCAGVPGDDSGGQRRSASSMRTDSGSRR
jgi:hypothetical protein